MAVPSDASCPKCGAPRGESATACARCGLSVDHMEAFAKERDAAIPDVLSAAWDRAVEHWDEPARHDEVMRLVAQHDAYAWAAARYRTRTGDPIGDRQLERVKRAAEATMLASASTRADSTQKPYRALTTVMVLLIVAAIGGLMYATVVRDRQANTPPSATPAQPVKPLTPIPHTGSQAR